MRGPLHMRTVSYSLYMRYIKRSYTDSYEDNIPVISVIHYVISDLYEVNVYEGIRK